ncbi:hypothetical protein OEZ85_000405 [Tetradesmus obliquus]|uniref:U-box domain-containing protein n=1 Tax=Tetradesmus obliquus TaxID=3088 RepID=A0ABY8US03_TETOB|nr:hypothetical protein OEZ85_000405 [Tetradesmus obliquus]
MGNEASVQAQAARADELALMQALLNGDLQAIQALLKQNPSLVYSHSKAGENLWHFAAQGGDAQVLKAVAAAVEGALAGQKKQDKLKGRINHEFNKVNQAVNQAISSAVPLPAAIAIPMSTDIGINAKTMDGTTPLMAAVKAGKPEAVAELLAAGADARRGDSSGATAVHHAAWQGQAACLAVLLQHGQQQEEQEAAGGSWVPRLVDVTTHTGLTPLHYAAWKGRPDMVKALVNAGASLAVPSVSDTMGAVAANAGSTPLHLAAMKGDASIVRLLLRANVKLMALATAEGPGGPLATAPAASGARGDVRKTADKYGKTAANLAWDMQRSDLALILDPSTPLEQAIELAAAAAKAGPPAAALPAAADHAPAKQPLPPAAGAVSLTEPPPGFVCPITNELLKDPVRACDGLTYERDAIEVWFQLGNSMMPGGHSRITSEQLTPDAQLREAIAAWKAAAAAGK